MTDDAIPSDIPMNDVDYQRHIDDRPRYPDGKGYVLFINQFVEHAHDERFLRAGEKVLSFSACPSLRVYFPFITGIVVHFLTFFGSPAPVNRL